MPFQVGNTLSQKADHRKPRRITQRLIAALGMPVEATIDEKKATAEHRIVRALIMKALEGDVPAVREIFDRVEGKVTQPVEVTRDPLEDLTADELRAFLGSIHAKSTGGDGAQGTSGIIETPPEGTTLN